MKTALVCGGGGFIGHHLVNQLKANGYWVCAVDLKSNKFARSQADEFIIGDLRDLALCQNLFSQHYDRVYQLAADMGGAGYLFTGENDADVMHNSAQINLNIVACCKQFSVGQVFYSSSACIYPQYNQLNTDNPKTSEASAYPAQPDSEYGWEKLFSERLYFSYQRCYDVQVKVARFHNVFGPEGCFDGGREKSPAALCRKIAAADDHIEVWGDGEQTRSFLYIDEALEALERFMQSDFSGPLNIGSEEMVSINQLAQMIMTIADKQLSIKHIEGPVGVRGRTSDNNLIEQTLQWKPSCGLHEGLEKTYAWIAAQVKETVNRAVES